jgi:hypothetical protein
VETPDKSLLPSDTSVLLVEPLDSTSVQVNPLNAAVKAVTSEAVKSCAASKAEISSATRFTSRVMIRRFPTSSTRFTSLWENAGSMENEITLIKRNFWASELYMALRLWFDYKDQIPQVGKRQEQEFAERHNNVLNNNFRH